MMNPYLPFPMRVSKSVAETDDGSIRTLSLSFARKEDSEAFSFRAGQFAELSLLGTGEAPFGIASSPVDPGMLDFTVSRIGLVTSELHNLETGDRVGMRGPLGNGYPLEELEGRNVLVVGGGFGFSTLRAFTSYALHPGNRGHFGGLTVVYGARNPGLLLYRQDLLEWGKRDDIDLRVTVDTPDDSWAGRTGVVPAVVRELCIDAGKTAALVCGPPAMIRYTLPVLTELGLPPERVFLSLEMKMKCGIGKCGRCNIGEAYVCTDGPVFSLARLNTLPGEY
ncbi:MAG: FAD/NAD(P)-binding protein [Candidatus Fermentibacteraceae bacterium]